jgi:hypothetical protein
MSGQMIVADTHSPYQVNEGVTVVVALFWVLGLASVLAAAVILCGWRGAKQVTFDWIRMKATFYCR